MKKTTLFLTLALLAPATATAKPLTISQGHRYSDRVVIPAVKQDAESTGDALVKSLRTRHCWQIASTIVGCRIELHAISIKGGQEVRCAQIATIKYRHGHSGALRWLDSDSSCWVPDTSYGDTV